MTVRYSVHRFRRDNPIPRGVSGGPNAVALDSVWLVLIGAVVGLITHALHHIPFTA